MNHYAAVAVAALTGDDDTSVEEAGAVLRFLDDAAAGNSPATGAVGRILGRPAISFDVWATEHAADFG